MTTFGARLRKERKRLKLSQPEFCKIGGVNVNTQGGYERGTGSPTADYLMKVAAAKVDLNYLFFGTYSPATSAPEDAESMAALIQLPPEQRAMSFAMMTVLGSLGSGGQGVVDNANAIRRAARMYELFIALPEAFQTILEAAAQDLQAAANTK